MHIKFSIEIILKYRNTLAHGANLITHLRIKYNLILYRDLQLFTGSSYITKSEFYKNNLQHGNFSMFLSSLVLLLSKTDRIQMLNELVSFIIQFL